MKSTNRFWVDTLLLPNLLSNCNFKVKFECHRVPHANFAIVKLTDKIIIARTKPHWKLLGNKKNNQGIKTIKNDDFISILNKKNCKWITRKQKNNKVTKSLDAIWCWWWFTGRCNCHFLSFALYKPTILAPTWSSVCVIFEAILRANCLGVCKWNLNIKSINAMSYNINIIKLNLMPWYASWTCQMWFEFNQMFVFNNKKPIEKSIAWSMTQFQWYYLTASAAAIT